MSEERTDLDRPGLFARIEGQWLPRLESGLLIAAAVVITLLIGFHVTARWAGTSVRWTEEGARLVTLWATFFAIPIYLRQRRLLTVDFFILLLPVRLNAIVQICIYLIIAVISVTLVVVGYRLAFVQWGQTSPGLTWPMTFFGLPIPIVSALMLIHLVPLIRNEVRVAVTGERPDRGGSSGSLL